MSVRRIDGGAVIKNGDDDLRHSRNVFSWSVKDAIDENVENVDVRDGDT
jgi:hypothetical protein